MYITIVVVVIYEIFMGMKDRRYTGSRNSKPYGNYGLRDNDDPIILLVSTNHCPGSHNDITSLEMTEYRLLLSMNSNELLNNELEIVYLIELIIFYIRAIFKFY